MGTIRIEYPEDIPAVLNLSPEKFEHEASNYIAPLGPMVDAFEKEFCERTGIPNSAAACSGTAAMHLVFRP